MLNPIREARVAEVLSSAPQSSEGTLRRAFSGSASPRGAIKAQCLLCVGFDRNEVKNCSGYSCPLWAYRPYQDAERAVGDAGEPAPDRSSGGRPEAAEAGA